MEKPHILTGPFGTELQNRERKFGPPGLSDPLNISDGVGHADAVGDLAACYHQAGTTVFLTNTFGERRRIDQPGGTALFDSDIPAHIEAVRRRVGNQPLFLSCGPARDCYRPDLAPDRAEAKDFHARQLAAARSGGVLAWFETIPNLEEARGIAEAAASQKVPVVISFVLGRNGRLLSGESLADAVRCVDGAAVSRPLGYAVNCSPVEVLDGAIGSANPKSGRRVIGAYPNASSLSPEELDWRALHDGVVGLRDPRGVARHLAYLAAHHDLQFIGGCCGHTPASVRLIAEAVRCGDYQSELPLTDFDPHYPAL